MRLVIWNVNKGFDRKIPALLELEPDLAILPESPRVPKLPESEGYSWRWLGENQSSGLGFLAGPGVELDDVVEIGGEHQWIGAVRAGGVTAIGVWAYYPRSPLKDESGPVRSLAPQILDEAGEGPAILAGDFNNSAHWDKPGREDNFKDLGGELRRGGLVSAYHHFAGEEFGKETRPTFFMQRNRAKPYHLDYCFLSRDLMERVIDVRVGDYDEWIRLSDHMPVIVDLG